MVGDYEMGYMQIVVHVFSHIFLSYFYYMYIHMYIMFLDKLVGSSGACDWKFSAEFGGKLQCGRDDEAVMGM